MLFVARFRRSPIKPDIRVRREATGNLEAFGFRAYLFDVHADSSSRTDRNHRQTRGMGEVEVQAVRILYLCDFSLPFLSKRKRILRVTSGDSGQEWCEAQCGRQQNGCGRGSNETPRRARSTSSGARMPGKVFADSSAESSHTFQTSTRSPGSRQFDWRCPPKLCVAAHESTIQLILEPGFSHCLAIFSDRA